MSDQTDLPPVDEEFESLFSVWYDQEEKAHLLREDALKKHFDRDAVALAQVAQSEADETGRKIAELILKRSGDATPTKDVEPN